MVAGTSTTNRTGASGGELLLEPVPGGDEPPSLRPGESPPSKPQWMRWRTFERKYAIWRRVVDSANGEFTICANADLAPAPGVDTDQPVTTAIARVQPPAQEPEIIYDVRQHCEAHQRRPTPRLSGGRRFRAYNARVARRPLRMLAMVKTPRVMASSTQDRAAAWNERRHDGRQNRCGRPPPPRTRNGRLHQTQAGASLIAASAAPRRSARRRGRWRDRCQRDGADRSRLAVERQPDLPDRGRSWTASERARERPGG